MTTYNRQTGKLSNHTILHYTVLYSTIQISHSVNRASWYTRVMKTNKMHFSILIYFENLSSTCFE